MLEAVERRVVPKLPRTLPAFHGCISHQTPVWLARGENVAVSIDLGIRVSRSQKTSRRVPGRWEIYLPDLREALRVHLKRRLPARAADHEDLLNDTLERLTAMRPPPAERSSDELRQIAFVILRNRIADLFRGEARDLADLRSDNDIEANPAPETGGERAVLLRRMLRITAEILAEAPGEDRALVPFIGERSGSAALTDVERQRLARLRRKLEEAIERQLGANVKDLLKREP